MSNVPVVSVRVSVTVTLPLVSRFQNDFGIAMLRFAGKARSNVPTVFPLTASCTGQVAAVPWKIGETVKIIGLFVSTSGKGDLRVSVGFAAVSDLHIRRHGIDSDLAPGDDVIFSFAREHAAAVEDADEE